MTVSPGLSFSLVLATVGRTEELANFLRHLDEQTYRLFELIVVDQNSDDRIVPLLSEYASRFPIRHLRSPRGLSRARNIGLPHAKGDVIAFPDDDCWYPPDLLERVAAILAAQSAIDGITGRPLDKSFSRFHITSGPINRNNVFVRCCSVTIFLRRKVVGVVGAFDEMLGQGTESGLLAGEESDYLIRALSDRFCLNFNADIVVFHKEPAVLYDDPYNRKARGYNEALGFVLRKHHYPLWYVVNTSIRPFGGMCLAAACFNWSKMRYHGNVAIGRIKGYFWRR
jgi:glycosyltransferase involved in cell wall biosynthesis